MLHQRRQYTNEFQNVTFQYISLRRTHANKFIHIAVSTPK